MNQMSFLGIVRSEQFVSPQLEQEMGSEIRPAFPSMDRIPKIFQNLTIVP